MLKHRIRGLLHAINPELLEVLVLLLMAMLLLLLICFLQAVARATSGLTRARAGMLLR
jgi:hypothetical protein